MVQPLQGIQAIQVISDPEPFATPEERMGGTADPRHAIPGEQSEPNPGFVTQGIYYGHPAPSSIEDHLLGYDPALAVDPAGTLRQDPTADLTPTTAAGGRKTHAAPWPKGVPFDLGSDPGVTGDRRQESAGIHSSDTGADRRLSYSPTLDAQQDNWIEYASVTPGTTLQRPVARATGAQVGIVAGTHTSHDRAQSLREQNEYGFDSAHLHRRVAQSPIPGNYDMLKPGSRPMVKRVAGYPGARGTGGESPFTGDSYGASFGTYGAILSDLPGEYVTPPEPALAAPVYSADESPGVDLF
jgi:hypothetical protein